MMLAIAGTAACSSSDKTVSGTVQEPETPGQEDDKPQDKPSTGGEGRYLVIYCSRTGVTRDVAHGIQEQLGCDILEVEPEAPYDNDYNAMLERARQELAAIRQGSYPAIVTSVESLDDYDTVFVGYPIWYGSMATPMQTFLHENSAGLAGKRVALFATSGSSGISASVVEARSLCPDADILDDAMLLTSSTLSQVASRITAWLDDTVGVNGNNDDSDPLSRRVNIAIGGRVISATMEDNASARDFLSRLPLKVTLADYNDTAEKIFYPSPALQTAGVARGCTPQAGDIAIYVPWGNVAVFCRSSSYNGELIKIGSIDGDGVEAFRIPDDMEVEFKKQ